MSFLSVLIYIILFFASVKLFIYYRTKWCKNKVCLVGKTIIITGANTGIGYESALEFAKRGARIILACRNEEKAKNARERIIKATRNPNIFCKLVDMSSMKSINKFVEEFKASEERLDILVNNAGVGGLADKKSQDGLQMVMQVNHFGPFHLTMSLLDLLKKNDSPTRIINVSSLAAKYAELDIEHINDFSGVYGTYSNSKLCNILFTKELARRLTPSNVTVYTIHPGVVKTEIFRRFSGYYKIIYDFVSAIYFKSPEEGAQTIIYAATELGLEVHSGEHFVECCMVTPYHTAKDVVLQKRLFETTEEILKSVFNKQLA